MRLFYEYINDDDMAMAQDFERRRVNSRRRDLRAARRFISDMQLIFLMLTTRGLKK